MTVKQIFKELKSLGTEKQKNYYLKNGAPNNLFGAKLGDIRKISKTIKVNHELAVELWKTENVDARFLACLIIKPNQLSLKQLDKIVKETKFVRVADWVNAYIVKKHPENEAMRIEWMNSKNHMAARAGWNLTSQRASKKSESLDIPAILLRLESEMPKSDALVQWTMNFTLVEIGINFPKYRKQALKIGEELGIYRDYPTVKGCTSPYAPIWISEMVKRQK